MADDDSSELSSLSSLSPAPSEDESDVELKPQNGILKFFHKLPKKPVEKEEMAPAPPKREPSPPHEYVLADNPDIAFIVMFRDRFRDALPKSLAPFGPQELEREVVDTVPSDRVEHFLCAILGLLLNRKQDIKPGHYNRALEDAISGNKTQWPRDWEEKTPLEGGVTFNTMTPVQRLSLLRTLILWALGASDVVKTMVNHAYKHPRREDDHDCPLSVQPWGADTEKRRYFLIEGRDDTSFRIYRESNPAGFDRTWWSVAGTIDELKMLTEKIAAGGPKGAKLSRQMLDAIPRFEASEEKRKRREYRQMRKQQFKRPEPGFSLYEGRTRGKRMKYTYSDDEDFFTDSTAPRRSTRNTRHHTPADPAGPVVTASGRQVRQPNRMAAEGASSGARSVSGSIQEEQEDTSALGPTGRPRRSAAVNHTLNGWASKKRKSEEYESDEDEDEGSEPDYGDDEDEHVPDESEEDEDEFDEEGVLDEDEEMEDQDVAIPSLIVKLRVRVKRDDETGKMVRIPREDIAERRPQYSPETSASSASPRVVQSETHAQSESPASLPEKIEEVISVAVKRKTPEPVSESRLPTHLSPLTPSSGPPTALAFRGSPEKPQHVPQPLDVGYVD